MLATDGVWDMLDNSEGIDIAARASGDGQGEPGFAARLVCETARRAWEFKETRIDDITCLLVFLPLVQDSPDAYFPRQRQQRWQWTGSAFMFPPRISGTIPCSTMRGCPREPVQMDSKLRAIMDQGLEKISVMMVQS